MLTIAFLMASEISGYSKYVLFPSVKSVYTVSYTHLLSGFFHSAFGSSLCAYSINGFQIPAAQFNPSHVPFVSFPSTFPAHTTVVICGEYPTVQRSRGSIFLLHQSLTSLLEVPVLTAIFLPHATVIACLLYTSRCV